MAGDTIDQKIEENLTYDYFTFVRREFLEYFVFTGYLTRDKGREGKCRWKDHIVRFQTKEIREIF